MNLTKVFIVQSKETNDFLYPADDGDVGYTELVTDAGYFYYIEDAINAGLEYIGRDLFVIFSFYSCDA